MPTFAHFLKFLSTIYALKKKKKAFMRNEAVWVGMIKKKKAGRGESVIGIKC